MQHRVSRAVRSVVVAEQAHCPGLDCRHAWDNCRAGRSHIEGLLAESVNDSHMSIVGRDIVFDIGEVEKWF